MKRLFSLVLLSSILLVTMSARPIRPSVRKFSKTYVDVYLNNGTAWNVTLNISGSIYSEGPESCGEVGSTGMSSVNVTLSTNAPGTHQFLFTGATTQITSGSASWSAVSVNGDITAAVY